MFIENYNKSFEFFREFFDKVKRWGQEGGIQYKVNKIVFIGKFCKKILKNEVMVKRLLFHFLLLLD